MWGTSGVGMALMMLALWGLVIAGLALPIRWLATRSRQPQEIDSPLHIARRRYARGEITREEFEALERDPS